MILAAKTCVLTLLLCSMVGAAAGAQTERRWAVLFPAEIQARSGTILQDLAEELGMEVEKLQAAVQNVLQKRVEQLKERMKAERQEERKETAKEQPERRPDRQTIIIQPQLPNRTRLLFPPRGVQSLRPGLGIQWRFYPGYSRMPSMYFRVWPGRR